PDDVVFVGTARAPDDVVFLGRRAPDDVGADRLRLVAAASPDRVGTVLATAARAPDDVVLGGQRALYRPARVRFGADRAPHDRVAFTGRRGAPRDVEAPGVRLRPKHAAADSMSAPVDVLVPWRRVIPAGGSRRI